ncbi:ATP-dependent endonuclease [Vibrio parahaemolyticus]|uniref:ATP-dependent nuclease n=1 Tax=Vibrio parahaemolyticus TaxID=670 RepID=UPI00111FB04E|nr:AAA family ATPase [Vibrio parahaemolyticus]EJG0706034.1 AAA family ATPase [Vibrio parahaemolyticus]EJX1331101.1 AAA family ATPase [Vibrio parahaemolyticus]MBE4067410.1 AAA family ATPase [Vibrio parahaemolyticus]MBE4109737.1 AAA family ATPase [Vibrio parahaemolyticus]TOK18861.1 ATP-dependent endonuclease [Vibrio parahaemolyticus]
MSILVDKVRIDGFRGISNLELSLPKTTVLIGMNNAGKTSIIKALQLSLGDYSRYLTDEDFHIDSNDRRTQKIVIDIRIIPVNNSGVRKQIFDDVWLEEFEDKVQQEAAGNQFFAMRTIASTDSIRGGFQIERYSLDRWVDTNWLEEPTVNRNKIRNRIRSVPYVPIDAQRDLHNELKERSSFVGKVLSSVEYNDEDVKELETLVAEVNQQAIDKSEPLSTLKANLDSLSQSFDGKGKAELSPFPKKIRDLSKRFSIHFGEEGGSSYSMEYHGMGTRSWASMLTVKAMIELMARSHANEEEPFFPIVAAEEPEAHLHVNAQRTLFQQLSEINGQVIVSTHSPYLASMSDLADLRGLYRTNGSITATQLIDGLDKEDINILRREVMRVRGDILFSKALILFEGVSEEQLIPAMFENYFGYSPFTVGISCISVAGKNYKPFIKMACSFGIPVFIVSDNDGTTKDEVEAQIRKIKQETSLELTDDQFAISYLNEGHDIEAELVSLDMREEIDTALVLAETRGADIPGWVQAKTREISSLTTSEVIEKMRGSKASYAGFLSEVISSNPNNKQPQKLIPEAVIIAFDKVKEWALND